MNLSWSWIILKGLQGPLRNPEGRIFFALFGGKIKMGTQYY